MCRPVIRMSSYIDCTMFCRNNYDMFKLRVTLSRSRNAGIRTVVETFLILRCNSKFMVVMQIDLNLS